MSEVKLIGKTVETTDNEHIIEETLTFSGKAAGICYMPDDYFEEGIQNIDKANKRANNNIHSGHSSVFEHEHVNLIIHTSKMMAMTLNSLNLYSTSEKSGRYTVMKPETELEENLYTKWTEIFKTLISGYYTGDLAYTEKETEKLARENARYMLSAFVPTVFEYSVPFNRAVLTCIWLHELADKINKPKFQKRYPHIFFYNRMAKEAVELADDIAKTLKLGEYDNTLHRYSNFPLMDNKKIGITFFDDFNKYNKHFCYHDNLSEHSEYYGWVYNTHYVASLATIACAERHRTLHFKIQSIFNENCDDEIRSALDENGEFDCYVPKIIRSTPFELEWKADFKSLIEKEVLPLATLFYVEENGRVEDFIAKCKERCCARAQLEINDITNDTILRYYNESNSDFRVRQMISSMIEFNPGKDMTDISVRPRCKFPDFTCSEGCKYSKLLENGCRII